MIFISHRSIDKEIADCFCDFLIQSGVKSENIFCSSLPGNDIQNKISAEIHKALKTSSIDIVLLSRDYYNSIYCLNELGAIWFKGKENSIAIALPEFTESEMIGFYNSENKIRRLDDESDILGIFDIVSKELQISASMQTVSRQAKKLLESYKAKLGSRATNRPTSKGKFAKANTEWDALTDEEKVVLYYCATRHKHRINAVTIETWSNDDELEPFFANDTFDLLQRSGYGEIVDENKQKVFVLDVNIYKTIVADTFDLSVFKEAFEKRIEASVNRFSKLWESGKFGDVDKLFILYIIEERMNSFGDRWMAEGQKNSISSWETKNSLDSSLQNNYGACLQVFVDNKLVYPSSFTSYGNPREFTLMTSVKRYLLSDDMPYIENLQLNRAKFVIEPF